MTFCDSCVGCVEWWIPANAAHVTSSVCNVEDVLQKHLIHVSCSIHCVPSKNVDGGVLYP